jgi:2-polyprenyl-6-methoxyphenol hydroxylase-like FAD-dependent oxidoreductase
MARAVVVGAGIGGLTAAVALQQRGWQVTVLERAPEIREVGAGLAMAPNALAGLDTLGLGDRIRALSALQGDAGIRHRSGRWISRTHAEAAVARYGNPTVVLHRAVLVDLIAAALKPGTVRTGVEVQGADPASGKVATSAGDHVGDLVVAADGIDSTIRRAVLPRLPGPAYLGATSWRMIAPAPPGPLPTCEFWGAALSFGVSRLADGRAYCYATADAPAGARAPDERAELRRLFAGFCDPVPTLIDTAESVLRTDLRYLPQVPDRFDHGRVVLLGDAAHAMTPNLGQGACQAVEDAVTLAGYAGHPDGPARYSAARVARTRDIAARSRRIGTLTRLRNPLATGARDLGLRLAGLLGPNVVLRQMDPILGWRPPTGATTPAAGSRPGR